jgi:hypothetical protein
MNPQLASNCRLQSVNRALSGARRARIDRFAIAKTLGSIDKKYWTVKLGTREAGRNISAVSRDAETSLQIKQLNSRGVLWNL